MISISGAATIATVYPIGILVIGFNLRDVPKVVAVTSFARGFLIWINLLHAVALVGGLLSTQICLVAVSSDVKVHGWESVVVAASGYLLSISVGLILLLSFGAQIGFFDAGVSARKPRAHRRPQQNERVDDAQ